jgi:hypothetical protein
MLEQREITFLDVILNQDDLEFITSGYHTIYNKQPLFHNECTFELINEDIHSYGDDNEPFKVQGTFTFKVSKNI